jgi:hypothetical protein
MALGNTVNHRQSQANRAWANPSWWNLLVVLPWTIGAIFFIYQWKVDRDIAMREQTTQGVVTAHEPANHNRFGYTFSVNGRGFTGRESPRKDNLYVGKQVLVYYDPLDPNKNALTEFRELGLETLGPVPMIFFGIGAVVWFIKTRRRNSQTSSDRSAAPTSCP